MPMSTAIHRRTSSLLPAAAALLLIVPGAGAQGVPGAGPDSVLRRPLTLEETVQEAVEGNPDLEASRLRERMAAAGVQGATSALLPRVEVISGWQRTSDPVGVFGTKLRQGRFTRQDLAIDALNDPAAVSDWTSAAELRWSVLDPRRWSERSAASSQAAAAKWRAERTREATEYRARALYYNAARAEAELEAARSAEDAAEADLELFRKRRDEGLLTDAEVLQAEAELEAARAERIEARGNLRGARERLGLFLGWSPDSVPVPSDTMAAPEAVESRDKFDPGSRADLRALEAMAEAARSEENAAWRRYLPALDAFGRWAVHDADTPLGSDGDQWSVGVQLRWTLFAGLGREAARRRADLAAQEARLQYTSAVREATAEVRRARRAVESARQRVEATRAARRAAERGRDLTRRRFEEGLAIASDVLRAESRVTAMRSRAIEALAGYHVARARLLFARSQDVSDTSSPGGGR